MIIKKIFSTLHLWLGLASGIIVFIVCITAATWAFSPEIESITQPYRSIPIENKPFISLAKLHSIGTSLMPDRRVEYLIINHAGKAAVIEFSGKGKYKAYVNPYSGKLQALVSEKASFFHWVIKGHTSLWLGDFGEDIVHWATPIFLLMLISGFYLWYPRNKAASKQRFSIKSGSSFARLNYDLHAVLGFYASLIIVFSIITAIVWSFDAAENAEIWLANAGKPTIVSPLAISIPSTSKAPASKFDTIFQEKLALNPTFHHAEIEFPEHDSDALSISYYHFKYNYHYNQYYFDQYSYQEIPAAATFYQLQQPGEKLRRMNFDIHTGNILGLTGRTVLFFASLLFASLPITGFLIWLRRNTKKKHTNRPHKSM